MIPVTQIKSNSEMELLLEKITFYRQKKDYELQLIKQQYENTKQSFQPNNLIKNSFVKGIANINAKSFLISIGIGLATNFLKNKIQNNPNNGPIKNIIASILKLIKK